MLNSALARSVPDTFAGGLTSVSLGRPDVDLARRQHVLYLDALREAGLAVDCLAGDGHCPDSCFVEDTAVRIDAEQLVFTRPGHSSRQAEVAAVAARLASRFARTSTILAPGCLDGGDVMRVEIKGKIHFLIGLSSRTNREGARQLGAFITAAGLTYSTLQVEAALHLKSSSSYLGGGRVLSVAALRQVYEDLGLDVITVPQEESYAANVVSVNGRVIFPSDFPCTAHLLSQAGYHALEVPMSEFRKQDGGLTCLSILY